MNANDPTQALADCAGDAVKVIEGAAAGAHCKVPLWLDPPEADAPVIP